MAWWMLDSESQVSYFKWRLMAGTILVCCTSFVFLIESFMFWAFSRDAVGTVTRITVDDNTWILEFEYVDARGNKRSDDDRIPRPAEFGGFGPKPTVGTKVKLNYVSFLGTKARLAREKEISVPLVGTFLVSLLATVGLFVWAIRSSDGPTEMPGRSGYGKKRR